MAILPAGDGGSCPGIALVLEGPYLLDSHTCATCVTIACMKNWKTTVAGIAVGSLVLIVKMIQAHMAGGPPITVETLVLSVGIATLGVLSKDYDVTGGERPQPSSAEATTIKLDEAANLGSGAGGSFSK